MKLIDREIAELSQELVRNIGQDMMTELKIFGQEMKKIMYYQLREDETNSKIRQIDNLPVQRSHRAENLNYVVNISTRNLSQ